MSDAEWEPNQAAEESKRPGVGSVLRFTLSGLNLGLDYPATEISAEIGRVAIAAARVDQELALLLSGLHAGARADWDFEGLRRRSSAWLCDKSLARVEELFAGRPLEDARDVVQNAYTALEHRHIAMHTVWTLTGPDAVTSVTDLLAARQSPDPDAALAALVGRDVDSQDWQAVHPRTGGPGHGSVTDLLQCRRELEKANAQLTELRFRLASALYAGRPPGAKLVVDPDSGTRRP